MNVKVISELLNEQIIEIHKCSRLNWKNCVYYCKTTKNEYALKIYYEIKNLNSRFLVEYKMYNFFSKISINVPKIIYFGKLNNNYILITEWINGVSLKKIVNRDGIKKSEYLIEEFLNIYDKIWNYNCKEQFLDLLCCNRIENKNESSMIYTRINNNKEEIFLKFKSINNIELIKNLYNKLEKRIIIEKRIINSDISLHEFIINNNKNYIIDLETFTIGDVNNDLAGIFYSLSNSIIDNENEIQYLFNILIRNKNFNLEKFLFYLIERVFCANYLDVVNECELNYYIEFILLKAKEVMIV